MADDFLRRNALRLLREKWGSPGALAQELYTILADEPSGGVSARSHVAQARQESAAATADTPAPEPPDRPPPRLLGTPRVPIEDVVRQLVARPLPRPIERAREPDHFLPGVVLAHGMVSPGAAVYVPPKLPEPWPSPRFEPVDFPPPFVDDNARAARLGGVDVVRPSVEQGPSRRRTPDEPRPSHRPSSVGPALPAPAHVEFAVPPTDTAYGYQPLGLPGAYSGQERTAGDYNPADGPIYREVPADDPFARKYYDLRFFLPDWDSPRATGGGGSTTLIGQVVSDGASPVKVALYPSGPNGSSSQTVPVTILQIADGEVIPKDTWITGILKGSDGYYAQLPVWLG